MSDSEVEFESADEGSKSNDGWNVEDFDLSDEESPIQFKPTETTFSKLPHISNTEDTKQNSECKNEDIKPSGKNVLYNTVPTLQYKLTNLSVNNDNKNCEQIPDESKVIQNEIKPTGTSNSVSINFIS